MFQFGGFLCGLASELFSRDQKEKCHLCAYAVTAKCSHPFRPCYTGIRTYLFQRAAVYREEMDRCNRAYFAYLDSIHDKEGMNSYMAEEALKTEYPWLSDHPEYAKCAIALWMLNHLEYTDLTELTPYALRELVKAVYVEAPDKSSGKRKQRVHIEYDLVGYIPVDELIKAEQT
ncbi:DUF4368 domain-containing protein [Flavonifractor sp. An306]|uniref:DUF4368 domain-containing protein n=1 Tax=Flavonifractor sp. An306 TaxID=1965629 RepID=UPI001FA90E58|nr:DUF4368 domain-containing protein [Flavonifractor sp. An306]